MSKEKKKERPIPHGGEKRGRNLRDPLHQTQGNIKDKCATACPTVGTRDMNSEHPSGLENDS